MTPAKARSKKGARLQEEARERQRYEIVPVADLKEHPQNPRRGSIEAIDESIDINGWYGACIVQESTMHILAGNHRYRTAKKRGARELPVILVDVDDDTAMRILLGDNRIADLGTYDQETLEACLEGLESLDGTGWGLDGIEADEEADEPEGEAPIDRPVPDDEYTPEFAVILVCGSEESQQSMYEKLQKAKLPEDVEVRVTAV